MMKYIKKDRKSIFVILVLAVIAAVLFGAALAHSVRPAEDEQLVTFRQRLDDCGENCAPSSLIIKDASE